MFVNLQFDESANTLHLCKAIQDANTRITGLIHPLSGKINKVFMFDKVSWNVSFWFQAEIGRGLSTMHGIRIRKDYQNHRQLILGLEVRLKVRLVQWHRKAKRIHGKVNILSALRPVEECTNIPYIINF